ncbi:MAG: type II toxin-antitoxin system HicA family toxin [Pseudolabrys sp.]
MARNRDQLLRDICNNPRNVRLAEACKAAEKLGFSAKGQKGSHQAYSKTGEVALLNFQKQKDGKIPTYQAKQLIAMIEHYWDFEKGEPKK